MTSQLHLKTTSYTPTSIACFCAYESPLIKPKSGLETAIQGAEIMLPNSQISEIYANNFFPTGCGLMLISLWCII